MSNAENTEAKRTETEKPSGPPWLRYVALLTGILAGLGGFLTVKGATMSNDAIYNETKAILSQTLASDQWNEYQADSIKKHMVEVNQRLVEMQLTMNKDTLSPELRTKYEGELKALEAEKQKNAQKQADPQKKATLQEAESQQSREAANKVLGEKSKLDIAGVAVQLGIALASVAALTRRKEAFIGGILAGAAGAGLTGYVLLHHFLNR